MRFANLWDIEQFRLLTRTANLPNAARAADALDSLASWANSNSDGWAAWPKPARAANNLITALEQVRSDYFRGVDVDLTQDEVATALRPVKAFLTRQGVDWKQVL